VAVGVAIVATLTTLGALDRPNRPPSGWNVRELAGVALMNEGDRCSRCHDAKHGVARPVEPGHISRPQDWLAMHVADPEVIALGVRPAPESNEQDLSALLAALARLRAGSPPAVDPRQQSLFVLVNRYCLKCHVIDGIGGDEGPELTHAGRKLDAATIAKRIADPKSVKPDSDMPSLADKLTPAEIQTIAAWVAAKK
jgi:cytochrome c553